MNSVVFQANLSSITAKVDGSLGLRLNTPELTPSEKVAIMGLQNLNLEATLKPLDDPEAMVVAVSASKDEKTRSERARGAIFRLWSLKKEAGEYVEQEFQTYYNKIMDSFIESIKQKMEDYG